MLYEVITIWSYSIYGTFIGLQFNGPLDLSSGVDASLLTHVLPPCHGKAISKSFQNSYFIKLSLVLNLIAESANTAKTVTCGKAPIEPGTDGWWWRGPYVITSYSIHYTKLYDSDNRGLPYPGWHLGQFLSQSFRQRPISEVTIVAACILSKEY